MICPNGWSYERTQRRQPTVDDRWVVCRTCKGIWASEDEDGYCSATWCYWEMAYDLRWRCVRCCTAEGRCPLPCCEEGETILCEPDHPDAFRSAPPVDREDCAGQLSML